MFLTICMLVVRPEFNISLRGSRDMKFRPIIDDDCGQLVSHYHTPSRELMAHTMTLYSHESAGYGGYLWTKK